jgi:hypothetical protein
VLRGREVGVGKTVIESEVAHPVDEPTEQDGPEAPGGPHQHSQNVQFQVLPQKLL